MNTYAQRQNDVVAFTDVLREALPELIRTATDGSVLITGNRPLPARTGNENAFQLFLSNGLSYRVWVQQIGEAEVEEAGCRECGELHAAQELNEHGFCVDCVQTEWSRMSVEERRQWCTVHRMHYPYTDRGPMSPAQLTYVSNLLASHPFRWAKTMPKNPHEYTLRREWADVGDEVFNEVVRMIREHGHTEWFGGYPWRMLNANGYKYWSYYSSFVEEVVVLNRKALPVQVRQTEEGLNKD